MNCPYAVPNCTSASAPDARRCRCGRFLKRCSQCAAGNRAFANFCRSCGLPLPASGGNWSAYRGTARRLGVHDDARVAGSIAKPPHIDLRLGDQCRGLLGWDGHLIAISLSGTIAVVDAARGTTICRFQTQGPITAEPCIDNGVLYLATRGQLTAYALTGMAMETPRVRPRWQLALDGTPIHALTVAGDRLYVTLAFPDRREIHVVEHLAQPTAARLLHAAPRVSWIAADADSGHAAFLSEQSVAGIRLHVARPDVTTYDVALRGLHDQPIAFLGGAIFGVFDEALRLYRIDAASGAIEEPLDEDTHLFALTHHANEWDRDGVRIGSDGVAFSRSGVRDSFGPYDRAVKGSPVIVRDSAVLVGMEDGRVRIYDAAQLPRYESWRIGDSDGVPITAVAAFDVYIAAGNRDGRVEVRELRASGAAS